MSVDSGPPWPGFVDALSTVLMMMVFFTLLMVLVTGTLSYIIAIKEVSPGAASSTEQVETLAAAAQDLSFLEKPSSMDKLAEAMNQSAELKEDEIMIAPAPPRVDVEKLEREKQDLLEEKKMLEKRVAMAESAAWNAHMEVQELKKSQDPELASKLQAALDKIKKLEAQAGEEKKIQTESEYAPPPFVTKMVQGITNQHRVIILYNKLTSTLEAKTRTDLLQWIKTNEAQIMSKGLLMTATLNHDGVSSSMSNSVSFKRLYGLIKLVSTEGRIPKKKIKFRALNDGVPGTNQVVVSVGDTFTKLSGGKDLQISVGN